MKILVRKVDADLYFDSQKYWKKIDDRMYGYDNLRGTLYPIWKEEGDFTILPPSQELLKSSQRQEKKKEAKILTAISDDQRAKPVSASLVPNQALEALYGGS